MYTYIIAIYLGILHGRGVWVIFLLSAVVVTCVYLLLSFKYILTTIIIPASHLVIPHYTVFKLSLISVWGNYIYIYKIKLI